MDTTELYSNITKNIVTIQQLRQSLDLLRQTDQLLYKKDVNIKDTLEQTLPFYLAETILAMINAKQISMTDISHIQQLIKELVDYMEKLPVAELVIAYVPSYRNLQEVADWWTKYTGRHVVLNVKIDESVISGAKISYEGIYKDYSLATWITQNAVGDIDQFNT